MGDIAGDHGQAVLQRGGGDLEIGVLVAKSGAERAPTSRGPQIERKDAAAIERQDPIEPINEHDGEVRIALLPPSYAPLDLTDGNHAEEDICRPLALYPRRH